MPLPIPCITNNPLTHSLFNDDFQNLAAPTPPGSEERETQDDVLRETQDGELRITE